MSALERARDRWGTAEAPPMPDDALARAAHPSAYRRPRVVVVIDAPEPSPGWWRCPECGRRRDREGDRARERWCTGGRAGTRTHAPVAMVVEGRP